MTGYVYFIKTDTKPPMFKIGQTHTSVFSRLNRMRIGCPFRLELYAVIPSENARMVEKSTHVELRRYRMRGEWFSAPREAVDQVLSRYKSLSKISQNDCGDDLEQKNALREIDQGIDQGTKCWTKIVGGEVYICNPLVFRDDTSFVSLSEIERDYPALKNHLRNLRHRIWHRNSVKK